MAHVIREAPSWKRAAALLVLVLGLLAGLLSIPSPAEAHHHTADEANAATSTRAHMVQVMGLRAFFPDADTNADVDDALDDAGATDTTCFSDISGDITGDGNPNSVDHRLRRLICYGQDQGVIVGTGFGTFSPDAPVLRQQVASFYARLLGVAPGFPARYETLYDDTPANQSIHTCNIHRISDLENDGAYSDAEEPTENDPFVIQGFEEPGPDPFPGDFEPATPISNSQAHLMGERARQVQNDASVADEDEFPDCRREPGPIAQVFVR